MGNNRFHSKARTNNIDWIVDKVSIVPVLSPPIRYLFCSHFSFSVPSFYFPFIYSKCDGGQSNWLTSLILKQAIPVKSVCNQNVDENGRFPFRVRVLMCVCVCSFVGKFIYGFYIFLLYWFGYWFFFSIILPLYSAGMAGSMFILACPLILFHYSPSISWFYYWSVAFQFDVSLSLDPKLFDNRSA